MSKKTPGECYDCGAPEFDYYRCADCRSVMAEKERERKQRKRNSFPTIERLLTPDAPFTN